MVLSIGCDPRHGATPRQEDKGRCQQGSDDRLCPEYRSFLLLFYCICDTWNAKEFPTIVFFSSLALTPRRTIIIGYKEHLLLNEKGRLPGWKPMRTPRSPAAIVITSRILKTCSGNILMITPCILWLVPSAWAIVLELNILLPAALGFHLDYVVFFARIRQGERALGYGCLLDMKKPKTIFEILSSCPRTGSTQTALGVS
jgi:hypothetical protein